MNLRRWALAFGFVVTLGFLSLLPGGVPQQAPQTAAAIPTADLQSPTPLCVLHDFGKLPGEPAAPGAGSPPGNINAMVQGPKGDENDFYSTTQNGGTHNLGMIFKITLSQDAQSATPTVLYNFGDGALKDGGKIDAAQPRGGLTLGSDGELYGTTWSGGRFNAGTIFRIAPAGGGPEIVYSFHGGAPDPAQPGQSSASLTAAEKQQQQDNWTPSEPISAPVLASDGNLYGVTPSGASNAGALYQVSPNSKNFNAVHLFKAQDAATNGLAPIALALGHDGYLYGTTWKGGNGYGTVFQFKPGNPGVKTIYPFKAADGLYSFGVIQAKDGNLYGTTAGGGPGGRGVAFRVTLDGQYTILHAFGGRESNPGPGLVEVTQIDPANVFAPADPAHFFLYGAAVANGSVVSRFDTGILFRVRNDGKEFAILYNTDATAGLSPAVTPVLASVPDPKAPVPGRDGNLFGTMEAGGSFSRGVFYRLDTSFYTTGIDASVKDPYELSPPPGQGGPAAPSCYRPTLIFQGTTDKTGNGMTQIYDDGLIQAATYVSAVKPGEGDVRDKLWHPQTAVGLHQAIFAPDGSLWQSLSAGQTSQNSTPEPAFTGATQTDNNVTWMRIPGIMIRVKDYAIPDCSSAPPPAGAPAPVCKDADTRAYVVQFFYKQRADSLGHALTGVLAEYDPNTTYKMAEEARVNGTAWVALKDNQGNPPPGAIDCVKQLLGACSNEYWTLGYQANGAGGVMSYGFCADKNDPKACQPALSCADQPKTASGVPGGNCEPLSTWIVDAQGRVHLDAQGHVKDSCQAANSPVYSFADSVVGCDGVTIYDSPTLLLDKSNETQTFAAKDFAIVMSHGQKRVIGTVTWQLRAMGAGPWEYTSVTFTGPLAANDPQVTRFAGYLRDEHFDLSYFPEGSSSTPAR